MKTRKNKARARICNPPSCKRITLHHCCDRCRFSVREVIKMFEIATRDRRLILT